MVIAVVVALIVGDVHFDLTDLDSGGDAIGEVIDEVDVLLFGRPTVYFGGWCSTPGRNGLLAWSRSEEIIWPGGLGHRTSST